VTSNLEKRIMGLDKDLESFVKKTLTRNYRYDNDVLIGVIAK
jgi:hypothetical protein